MEKLPKSFRTKILRLGIFVVLMTAPNEIFNQMVPEPGQGVLASVQYCNFDISNGKKLANLSFSVLYKFHVDENGRPVKITKVRDNYVGEKVVEACILNWKISGVPLQSRFFATFFWSHKKGWFRQSLGNGKYSQVMEMENIGVEKVTIDPKSLKK